MTRTQVGSGILFVSIAEMVKGYAIVLDQEYYLLTIKDGQEFPRLTFQKKPKV